MTLSVSPRETPSETGERGRGAASSPAAEAPVAAPGLKEGTFDRDEWRLLCGVHDLGQRELARRALRVSFSERYAQFAETQVGRWSGSRIARRSLPPHLGARASLCVRFPLRGPAISLVDVVMIEFPYLPPRSRLVRCVMTPVRN
jgi:hypothetical protein